METIRLGVFQKKWKYQTAFLHFYNGLQIFILEYFDVKFFKFIFKAKSEVEHCIAINITNNAAKDIVYSMLSFVELSCWVFLSNAKVKS